MTADGFWKRDICFPQECGPKREGQPHCGVRPKSMGAGTASTGLNEFVKQKTTWKLGRNGAVKESLSRSSRGKWEMDMMRPHCMKFPKN